MNSTATRAGARPHAGPMPRRIAFFPTCMADLAMPEPALAAARVLRRMGCEVTVPGDMVCCGQPALNSGHARPAARLLRSLVDSSDGFDAVVTIAGSCAATVIHHGPRLLGDEVVERPGYAKLWEFSQFLDAYLDEASVPLHLDAVVTYHDSCHMTRMLGETSAPRAVLARIDGIEVDEMLASGDCCGFGGTFSIKFPEVAGAMADQKLRHAADTRARYLVSSDPGCLVNIGGRQQVTGVGPIPIHLAEIVERAMGGVA